MASFNVRLKELRESRDLTTRDVANFLSVSIRLIQRYEKGERKPDIEGLKRLADFFEVSTDYLLGRTDDPTPPGRR